MGSFLQGEERADAGRLATAAIATSRGSIAWLVACISSPRGRAGVGNVLSSCSGKFRSIRRGDPDSDGGSVDDVGGAT